MNFLKCPKLPLFTSLTCSSINRETAIWKRPCCSVSWHFVRQTSGGGGGTRLMDTMARSPTSSPPPSVVFPRRGGRPRRWAMSHSLGTGPRMLCTQQSSVPTRQRTSTFQLRSVLRLVLFAILSVYNFSFSLVIFSQ